MDSFIGKAWSLLIALVVIIVMINLAIEAIRPYLPIVGIVLILLGVFYGLRFLMLRRRR